MPDGAVGPLECLSCRWQGSNDVLDPQCPECGALAVVKNDA